MGKNGWNLNLYLLILFDIFNTIFINKHLKCRLCSDQNNEFNNYTVNKYIKMYFILEYVNLTK